MSKIGEAHASLKWHCFLNYECKASAQHDLNNSWNPNIRHPNILLNMNLSYIGPCLIMCKTSVFPDRGHGKWGSSGGGGGVLRGMVQPKVFPTSRRLIRSTHLIAMHSAKAIPIDRGMLTVVAATHIFKMLEYTVYNCMTLRSIKKVKHIQDLSYMIVCHETSQNVACVLWHVAVLLLDLL